MEVEYELTRDDLFAYQWRAAYVSNIAADDEETERHGERLNWQCLTLNFCQ